MLNGYVNARDWKRVAMASCYLNPIPTSSRLISPDLSTKFKIPKLLHRVNYLDIY